MKTIKKGIVFSNDIQRILNGTNAFDYQYDAIPSQSTIENLRQSFQKDTKKIFNEEVRIITEDEMMGINNLVGGEYPHRHTR